MPWNYQSHIELVARTADIEIMRIVLIIGVFVASVIELPTELRQKHVY